jgi:osmoprotectant transport system ATP-binding protein
VLLSDEPFGAIDPITRDRLQSEFLRLQAELHKTVVFVTHDIDEAFLLGDQVVIMQQGGRISQAASPAEILAQPADAFVADFVGADRGKRALHVTEVDGRRVVVDADGRPAGVLTS